MGVLFLSRCLERLEEQLKEIAGPASITAATMPSSSHKNNLVFSTLAWPQPSLRGVNPTHPGRCQNDQPITKVSLSVAFQSWQQERGHILRRWRMRLHTNDAKVARQGAYDPVAEVLVEGDEASLLLNSSLQDQRIICSGLSGFRSTDSVVAART